eukprot:5422408-Amphidinium_carterae.1
MHPLWHETLHRYLDLIGSDLTWREKWAQLQLAFADAVDEISHLPKLDTSNCHTAYWSAVRALRCFQQRGPHHMQRLLENCKGWEHLTQLSTTRQLSSMSAIMADFLEQLMQEELAAPEAEWENGHRQGFLTKALAAWKSNRLLSPPPSKVLRLCRTSPNA